MELTKKTTILLPPDLHERLSRLAEQKGTPSSRRTGGRLERRAGVVRVGPGKGIAAYRNVFKRDFYCSRSFLQCSQLPPQCI